MANDTMVTLHKPVSQGRWKRLKAEVNKNRFIYLLLLPSIILVLVFSYAPLGGIKIAFQDYNIYNPDASEWVGMKNFIQIFRSPDTLKAVWNTLTIGFLNIGICFPLTILFALLLNEITNGVFKRVAQTISYLPHFLSWISIIGIATSLYAKSGIINDLIVFFTGNQERTLFLAQQSFFVPNVLILTLWQSIGWGSIIYLAAISGVDEALYEAAMLDGAGRLRQVWHVTLPGILPTIVIMLIWKCGSLFKDNFELIYGLQNAFVDFETIQTIVYKQGISGGNYQLTTAFGLFQGVVNFIFLFVVNFFAKKTTEVGVF